MKFGTFHLFSFPPSMTDSQVVENELEQMLWLEELGLDEAWLGEHNARVYGTVGSLQVAAAAIAARTKRIRIGAAVTRLPLHHPLHTAEDLALVDVISNGRFDWGIGKGYDPLEFASYDVDFNERDERWEEALDIILSAWRDGRIEHEGKYWTIPETELFPKPVQRPHPPAFLMVTRSDDSVIFAAKRLFPVIFGQWPDWDDVKRKVELYRTTAREAGHAEADIEQRISLFGQLRQMHVAPTSEQAAAEYREGLMWYYKVRSNRLMFGFHQDEQPYEYYLEHKSVLLGSPQELLEQIQAYREYTGINSIICWFNCGGQPQHQVRSAMELFAAKVMPHLR